MMNGLGYMLVLLTTLVQVNGKLASSQSVVCISESDSRDGNTKQVSKNITCTAQFCKVCNLKGVCKECNPGYFLKGQPTRCVPRCCKGHQLINGKCRKDKCTSIRHCLSCPGFFFASCIECNQGYYRYKHPLRFSTRCVRACPSGYEPIKGNGYHGPTCMRKRKCPFMPGCVECPTLNICKKCEQNMSIIEGILISRCVKECPKSYYKRIKNNASVCFPEEGCLDRFCFMCKRGWYKMFGKGKQCVKKCPIGSYTSLAGYCMKCPWGCEKCHRSFNCDKCSEGLIKLNGGISDRCVLACPRGHIKKFVNGTGYVCRPNCKVANCANCESFSFHDSHCDYCKPGYHKLHIDSNDKCVLKCPKGYQRDYGDFMIGGSVCRRVCPLGCEKCPTYRSYKCDKCSDGLLKLSSLFNLGIMYDRCVAVCPTGYTKEFVNGTGYICQKNCRVANCATCESFDRHARCDTCKPGYIKFNIEYDEDDECVLKCPKGYQRGVGDFGEDACTKVDEAQED